MTEKIMIAGVGGQGIQALGKIIVSAALSEDKHVTWLPSYGAEMRGGASNCHVIVSDEEIGSPFIDSATSLLAMSDVGVRKFEHCLKEDGLLCLNSSMATSLAYEDRSRYIEIMASDLADEIGDARFSNIVMLGAYLYARPIVSLESVVKELEKAFAKKSKALFENNCKALESGLKSAEQWTLSQE